MAETSVLSDPTVILDWIGGNCPVQAEGTVNGKPFYFRARGESWSMSIGGEDVVGRPEWFHEEGYGETQFAAGWMTIDEAKNFIAVAAKRYETEHSVTA